MVLAVEEELSETASVRTWSQRRDKIRNGILHRQVFSGWASELFRIRLLFGSGVGEGGERHTVGFNVQ